MVVYHGSNSNFKELKISKSLVKRDSSLLNEGTGIYFSTDYEVAKSYGKYIYTLEINDLYFIDLRDSNRVKKYIVNLFTYIKDKTYVNMNNYISREQIESLLIYLNTGGVSFYNLEREIINIADCNEPWSRVSETKQKSVELAIKKYTRIYAKAYMFNYNISNIGIIKDVSPYVVRIINKEKTT